MNFMSVYPKSVDMVFADPPYNIKKDSPWFSTTVNPFIFL